MIHGCLKKIELQVNKVKKSKNKVFFIHTNEIWMMNDKFLNQKKKHKKARRLYF